MPFLPIQQSPPTHQGRPSSFASLSDRFETVHLDIVGPLPPSVSHGQSFTSPYRYLLTCIDRATRWVEAAPLADISAATVAVAFMDIWVSRFGVPLHVVTDRGTQFEAAIFSQLADILGFHRLRTTAYHPKTNGMVERLHRTLKTAIIARKKQWLQALPVVLLGIRSTVNESGFAPFTAVTGDLLLQPRLSVDRQPPPDGATDTVRDLARRLSEIDFLTSSEGQHHGHPPSHLPADLNTCTHVWLRVDRVRRPLEAPYVGPLRVCKRSGRWFVLELPSGRTDTVSIERLKPAYLPQQPPPEVQVATSPPTAAPRRVVPPSVAPRSVMPPSVAQPPAPPPRRSRRLAGLPVVTTGSGSLVTLRSGGGSDVAGRAARDVTVTWR